MSGRKVIVTIVCLVGIHVAVSTFAQDETRSAPRRPSLAERLQRFRQDLFGGDSSRQRIGDEVPGPRSNGWALPNGSSSSRPVMVAPPGPQPQPSMAEASPTAQPQNSRSITVSPRMQLQSARRAKSGAPPVTVITPNGDKTATRLNTGSPRRPLQETRRRALGEPAAEEAEEIEIIEEDVVQRVDEPLDNDPEDAQAMEVVEESIAEVPSEQPTAAAETNPIRGDAPTDWQHYGEESPEPTESEVDIEEAAPRTFQNGNKLRPTEQDASVDEPQSTATAEPVAVPLEESTSDVLFTTQSPVLAVVASGPRTVMIGEEAEFVVKVTNSGAAANNVAIKVIVPHYADVASSRPSSGSAQPPSRGDLNSGLEWTIDRLEAGDEESLTLKLIPRKSSPLDLAVSYTFAPETSQTMVEVQEPKLAMNISGPSEVLFGQTKVYKLTISNPGNGDTHNVSVGLQPIGRSGETQGTHRLGTLAAGESKTIDIELTARQAGPIAIKAQSFADGGLRAEAAQEVLVRRAELQVKVEAPHVKYAGTPASYQIIVQNTGDALADGVELSAVLPPEAKFLAAGGGRLDPQQGRVTWIVGALPAGGERLFELQCVLNTPGENRLQVSVDGGGELTAAATTSTRVEAIADLKLEVRDPQGPVAVGDDAAYEIRIRNRGTKAAQGVDLAVFFSEGLEPTTADGGPNDIGTGQVIFRPIASIPAGDTAVFQVRARAASPGNHVFRAEVFCKALDTKLAAEEATHFYGDQRTAALPKREPTLAKPREASDEPQALEDAPPTNPYE